MNETSDSKTTVQLSPELPVRAVALAADLLRASRQHETKAEQGRTGQMARMMRDEPGKKFTIVMTDQVLKIADPRQAAARLDSILQRYGLPNYLSRSQRCLLWLGNQVAKLVPRLVMPQINRQVRRESAHVIVSEDPKKFQQYVAERQRTQWRINFNQLGEAVLGEQEAERRFQAYQKRLASTEIEYVSVKLSSIVSQISLTGYEQTLESLKARLRTLYRAAIKHGNGHPKFVNLDMEEYRDLQLTVDVFCQVLSEPEFMGLEAGIVLQAYLPDSFEMQQYLTQWARERVARGGAGIKIRLVKGANLAMEQVEASLRHWPQAPYTSKLQVDANYKRMLEYATRPEHAAAVRLGVASHNLFEIAFALLVREERGVQSRIEFEMLEGMANAQAVEVRKRTGGLVVYTPAVGEKEFEAAVAYLVRRLDENTAPGSFLGALFALQEGSAQWIEQRDAFMAACELAGFCAESEAGHELITPVDRRSFGSMSNRTQDRNVPQYEILPLAAPFENHPDTDFSLARNRKWAAAIVKEWSHAKIPVIPLEVDGQVFGHEPTGIGRDPSNQSREIYRFVEAGPAEVDAALSVAVAAGKRWREVPVLERARIIAKVGESFDRHRADTLGAMMVDCGKALTEGDVEVSEAIDFANYYARWWQPRRTNDEIDSRDASSSCETQMERSGWFDGTTIEPLGVVVVTPPWNFPFAIPAGGCLAALMAGNSVILKPSPESVLTAYELAKQIWAAGVPKDVLQFLPVNERLAGKQLITDPRTAAVILTGSSETASMFLSWRPNLPLYAETSGKNALIITAFADVDLAVKDLIRGAFGHAGQKCSATSIALVERCVYESEKFRHQLLDAARSLKAGSSHDPSAIVTPVIRPPDPNLQRGLTQLEEGESWLLEPKMIDGNSCLWTPGIRLGVKPGSWYHRTECFGPVLGLVCVDSLAEAIEIANSSDFGLTGGLHSLEPSQIRLWRESIQVGNAYINRGTTGAIVQRQPFGGWKNSSVGPGVKAGGPNYVACFGKWSEAELPKFQVEPLGELRRLLPTLCQWVDDESDRQCLVASARSYQYWWSHEFSLEHDPSRVHGEANHFRYCPRPLHVVRVGNMSMAAMKRALAQITMAAVRTGTRLELSVARVSSELEQWQQLTGRDLVVEDLDSLYQRLGGMIGGTVRVLGDIGVSTLDPLRINKAYVAYGLPLSNGRLELQLYVREQAISETVHRYGNLV
ncbi:MAG: bifunctional proline dehydrogenase/L-glutamate gamma-semialdehyde dehydrogenase [Planctomycetaceae bacterium]|nr:bifunctional proline dehydrogenase/L-glutamate gamma-semialdehyde dehydrogenase [Planctomycetaceae bacterium]